jgi:hypothetical protein
MRTLTLIVGLGLAVTGCNSGHRKGDVPGQVIEEDAFTRAARELAARIPSGSRVAIAEPVQHLSRGLGVHILDEVQELPHDYSVRMEGALAEAIRDGDYVDSAPKVLTRVHLDPILAEADLEWALLAKDAKQQVRLAKLTDVDTLVTWHVSLEGENTIANGDWYYDERWTLQALRLADGELLGSVTLQRNNQRLPIH